MRKAELGNEPPTNICCNVRKEVDSRHGGVLEAAIACTMQEAIL